MTQVKKANLMTRIPPHVYFFVSAIFHYLDLPLRSFSSPVSRYLGWHGSVLPVLPLFLRCGAGRGALSLGYPGRSAAFCSRWASCSV